MMMMTFGPLGRVECSFAGLSHLIEGESASASLIILFQIYLELAVLRPIPANIRYTVEHAPHALSKSR